MSGIPTIYPIFNPNDFNAGTQNITLQEAESLFLALSGGRVSGSLQVGQNEQIVGRLAVNSSTPSTTTSSGALVVAGGIGCGSQATINNIKLTAITPSTTTSTGALVVAGGVGVAGRVNAANLSAINGVIAQYYMISSTLPLSMTWQPLFYQTPVVSLNNGSPGYFTSVGYNFANNTNNPVNGTIMTLAFGRSSASGWLKCMIPILTQTNNGIFNISVSNSSGTTQFYSNLDAYSGSAGLVAVPLIFWHTGGNLSIIFTVVSKNSSRSSYYVNIGNCQSSPVSYTNYSNQLTGGGKFTNISASTAASPISEQYSVGNWVFHTLAP